MPLFKITKIYYASGSLKTSIPVFEADSEKEALEMAQDYTINEEDELYNEISYDLVEASCVEV